MSTPSFSSALLDRICRSIDGNEDIAPEFKASSSSGISRANEEISSFQSACLVENSIEEKQVCDDVVLSNRKLPSLPEFDHYSILEDEFCFLGLTSCSSNSRSSCETFGSETGMMKKACTCFSWGHRPETNELEEYVMIDDYQNHQTINTGDDCLIQPNSRFLENHENMKKPKHPCTLVGRLTSLISSLFGYGSEKKNEKHVDPYQVSRNYKSPPPTRNIV